jgi:hypothetical protein
LTHEFIGRALVFSTGQQQQSSNHNNKIAAAAAAAAASSSNNNRVRLVPAFLQNSTEFKKSDTFKSLLVSLTF